MALSQNDKDELTRLLEADRSAEVAFMSVVNGLARDPSLPHGELPALRKAHADAHTALMDFINAKIAEPDIEIYNNSLGVTHGE